MASTNRAYPSRTSGAVMRIPSDRSTTPISSNRSTQVYTHEYVPSIFWAIRRTESPSLAAKTTFAAVAST